MKKITMALTLCIIATAAFAQEWDYLKEVVTFTDTTYTDYYIYINHKIDLNRKYDDYVLNYNRLDHIQEKIKMPTQSVMMNYKIGNDCITSGTVFISIGSFFTLIGGICMATAYNGHGYHYIGNSSYAISDNNLMLAGSVMTGIGGGLIGISIPLFCFGDHTKRMCNMFLGK